MGKLPLNDALEPIVAPSAHKHGLSRDAITHAYRNPLRAWLLDDGLIMLIGADAAGALLEIGVVRGDQGDVIVHAMPARPKFLWR